MRSLEQHAPRDINKVLVGNKCDLVKEREVTDQMGQEAAEEYGLEFFETSAMTGSGVEDCFMYLARRVKERMANGKLPAEGKDGTIVLNAGAGEDQPQPPNPVPPCSCLI
jgi:GTPase SAR1 family protein